MAQTAFDDSYLIMEVALSNGDYVTLKEKEPKKKEETKEELQALLAKEKDSNKALANRASQCEAYLKSEKASYGAFRKEVSASVANLRANLARKG